MNDDDDFHRLLREANEAPRGCLPLGLAIGLAVSIAMYAALFHFLDWVVTRILSWG